MTRVVVLGRSGSGKTTLAKELARHLGVLHVELDAIHSPAELDEWKRRIGMQP